MHLAEIVDFFKNSLNPLPLSLSQLTRNVHENCQYPPLNVNDNWTKKMVNIKHFWGLFSIKLLQKIHWYD